MCGIVGIAGVMPVNQSIYDALTVLQHRGQDAAGIITIDANNCFRLRKANGLVSDVFEARHMQRLQGNMGIGHVRYPTAGSSSASEAQPFYVNSPYGITLAHNGNLTNAHELRKKLFEEKRRHINTTSDSEILLNIFASELDNFRHYPLAAISRASCVTSANACTSRREKSVSRDKVWRAAWLITKCVSTSATSRRTCNKRTP
jgi:amidophosphoribosyltransferase